MRYRALMLTTALFGAFAAAAPASAQEGIEIVTVTARQRSESIQVTPVAVTAVTEKTLEKLFVKDLTSLSRVAPGFTIEAVGAINRTAAVIYSRGIGYSGIDQAIEPDVGVSVDGTFYPKNQGMLQQMYDATSVEILRGPQGTLFGKNTTAGVIQIKTTDPQPGVYSIEGYLKMGNYGRSDYGAKINIPLTDSLTFRLTAQSAYSDGYVKNTYINPVTGNGPASRDAWLSGDDIKTYRGALRYQPNDNLDVVLKLTYIKDRSDSAGGQNGSSPCGGFGPGFPAAGDALSCALGYPGFGYGAPPPAPQQVYVVQRNYANFDGGDSFFATLNVNYKTQWFNIESNTGFQKMQSLTYSDFDDTGLAYFETYTPKRSRYFQQEVRLLSNDDDARFTWVGGIFYNWYWFSVEQQFQVAGSPTFTYTAPNLQTREAAQQNAWSIAPYFQADFKITDQLTLTGGIRYLNETKKINRNFTAPPTTFKTPATTVQGEHTWDAFIYHANLNYRVTDDAMVYASYSTGYKSGAFNSRAGSGLANGLPIDFFLNPPAEPETVDAIEIGAKTAWFDNRLIANVSAYYNEYKDLQVTYFPQLAGATGLPQVFANKANQVAQGIELEIQAVPMEHLNVSASISYMDSHYTSFVADLGALNYKPTACTASGGNANPDHSKSGPCYLRPYRSPQWTGKMTVGYDWMLPRDMGMLTPTVTVGLISTYSTDLNNHPNGFQPTYADVDGSLTYTDPTDRYKVSLWGKNVTNVRRKLSDVPSGPFTQLYFAEPRTFGVQLDFKLSSEQK